MEKSAGKERITARGRSGAFFHHRSPKRSHKRVFFNTLSVVQIVNKVPASYVMHMRMAVSIALRCAGPLQSKFIDNYTHTHTTFPNTFIIKRNTSVTY
jgi:hypothetical protein